MTGDKVLCRTPNPDRPGTTRIPAWKFDLVRGLILDALGTGDIAFRDLAGVVGRGLSGDEAARLGSLGWHVTVVKLELEVRGEISRVAGVTPQTLTKERG